MESKRNYSLDMIRLWATMAVVMIHCSSDFIKEFAQNSAEFAVGNVMDALCRLGVPLFVMVSGALFLNEEKTVTIKGILQKNVKPIVAILMFWSAFYAVSYQVVLPWYRGKTVVLMKVVKAFLQGHYHLWYLYMTIGLYLITPFLRQFVSKSKLDLVRLYLGVALLVQFTQPCITMAARIFPDLKILITVIEKCRFDFFAGYVAYFILGWYLAHVGIPSLWARRGIYALSVLSVLGMIGYVQITGNYQDAFDNLGLPVLFYSAGVFLWWQNRSLTLTQKQEKRLVSLSKRTFGVYVVHVFLLNQFQSLFPYSQMPLLYVLGSFVAVFVGSFLVSYLLSYIPWVKTMVRG